MGVVNGSPESIRRDNILDLDSSIMSVATSVISSAVSSIVSYPCAVPIGINKTVALNGEGKLILASQLINDGKECFGISKTAGNTGDNIELYKDGDIITIDNATFATGKRVFIDGSGNFTTTFVYAVGSYLTNVGVAINSKSFKHTIQQSTKLL